MRLHMSLYASFDGLIKYAFISENMHRILSVFMPKTSKAVEAATKYPARLELYQEEL